MREAELGVDQILYIGLCAFKACSVTERFNTFFLTPENPDSFTGEN